MDMKMVFRKREAYSIFFVPYFLSETGILFEFNSAKPEIIEKGFSVKLEELQKFGKDLMLATKKRHAKPIFPSDRERNNHKPSKL
jgi:hypothetical protein